LLRLNGVETYCTYFSVREPRKRDERRGCILFIGCKYFIRLRTLQVETDCILIYSLVNVRLTHALMLLAWLSAHVKEVTVRRVGPVLGWVIDVRSYVGLTGFHSRRLKAPKGMDFNTVDLPVCEIFSPFSIHLEPFYAEPWTG